METVQTTPKHRAPESPNGKAVDFDEIRTPPRPLLTVLQDLAGSLANDAKQLFQQELSLAKAEAERKASLVKKEAIVIAVAITLALIGLALLLVAVALVCTLFFQALGLSETLSYFAGFGAFGLLSTLSGGALLLRSKSHLAREGLTPKKATQQLNETKIWAKQIIK